MCGSNCACLGMPCQRKLAWRFPPRLAIPMSRFPVAAEIPNRRESAASPPSPPSHPHPTCCCSSRAVVAVACGSFCCLGWLGNREVVVACRRVWAACLGVVTCGCKRCGGCGWGPRMRLPPRYEICRTLGGCNLHFGNISADGSGGGLLKIAEGGTLGE